MKTKYLFFVKYLNKNKYENKIYFVDTSKIYYIISSYFKILKIQIL